jgi:hypothetical protein
MGGFRRRLYGSDEPVPTAGEGLNVLWSLSGIAQGPSRFLDRGIQSVFKIHERVGSPEPLAKCLAGDQFARSLEQCDQNLARMLLEADSAAVAVQITRDWIQLESSEANAGSP